MPLITTGNHPKALTLGVKKFYGRAYDEHVTEYTDLFEMQTSDKSYEEVVESVGFGLASVKGQGEAIVYDSDHQGPVSRFTGVGFALGFMISWEEFRFNLYMDVVKRRAPDLALSMRQTHEQAAANVYNRGFNADYTGGDGVEMLSTAHPTDSGNQSNELTTPADLSEAAIEDLIIQIEQMTDARGRKIAYKPMTLHIAPGNAFEAYRILKSVNQNDTANNAVNALRAGGYLPGGVKVNHWFTDTDAWFIRTNCPWSMLHFQSDPMMFDEDNDFDTKNKKYAAYERWIAAHANFRGVYGSAGA